MKDAEIRAMVLELLKQADYDLWKALNPATSDEPELVEYELTLLVKIAKKHIGLNKSEVSS